MPARHKKGRSIGMKRFFNTLVATAALVAIFALVGCGRNDGDETVLVIGATAVPHYEILLRVVDVMAEEGFTLELREFSDFSTPNPALQDGSIDANFFQHRPFLDNFNAASGAGLVPVFGMHFEPLRVYAGRLNSLESIPSGAVFAIPNDPTNETRALQLMEFLGLITLHAHTRGTASATTGIATNPHNLEIRPVVAQSLPSVLPDVDFAIINGNVALQGGVIGLAIPGAGEDLDPNARLTFTNYVVVRPGYENDPRIVALINALDTDEIQRFIEETYLGRVVPTRIRP